MREVRSQWSISNPKVKLMIHVTMYIYIHAHANSLYIHICPHSSHVVLSQVLVD